MLRRPTLFVCTDGPVEPAYPYAILVRDEVAEPRRRMEVAQRPHAIAHLLAAPRSHTRASDWPRSQSR